MNVNPIVVGPDLIVFDFDGVFTDNCVYTDNNGNEFIKCSKYDSQAIGLFQKEFPDIRLLVLSNELSKCVLQRCNKLGLELLQVKGDKSVVLEEFLRDACIEASKVVYIGNDVNDVCIKRLEVGTIYAPCDAAIEFINVADQILDRRGGDGAVREVLNKIRSANETRDNKPRPQWLSDGVSMGERDWGEEDLIALCENKYSLKRLRLRKGSKGGLQYHHRKDECGYLAEGKLLIRYQSEDDGNRLSEKELHPGDFFRFLPGCIHQEEALEDCVIIEVSTPYYNDRVRVESDFGLPCASGLPSTNKDDVLPLLEAHITRFGKT